MDVNFEQLLAQHNQDFKDAEVFNNWMPPDGEYIVSLTKLDKGSSTKDGKTTLWWKLTGRIEDVQDEKLNGEEFQVGYYSSKAFGVMKGAVKTLAGQLVDDLDSAHQVLESSLGKIIKAKVTTKTSKKDGNDYTNCYIQEVINTVTEATGGDEGSIVDVTVSQPEVVYADSSADVPPTVQ